MLDSIDPSSPLALRTGGKGVLAICVPVSDPEMVVKLFLERISAQWRGGETVEFEDSEMFQAPRLWRVPSGEGDWINTSVSTSGHDSHGLEGETDSRDSGTEKHVRSKNGLWIFVSVRCD